MTGLENSLRRFLSHQRRGWFVIILTFGVGLAIVLPAVDEYTAQQGRHAQLEAALIEAQQDAQRLPLLQKLAADQKKQIEDWQKKSISEDSIHEVRGRLVEMARDAGCQVRRVQVGLPRIQPWREDDHPLNPPQSGKRADTPYQLRAQTINLMVSGSIAGVKTMLTGLQTEDKLMHMRTLQLRPANPTGSEVQLEMEVTLFGLEDKPSVKAGS